MASGIDFNQQRDQYPFGFQLSDGAFARYGIAELLAGDNPVSAAADVYTLRRLADRLNVHRLQADSQSELIYGGQLASLAVLTDIQRFLITSYFRQGDSSGVSRAVNVTAETVGTDKVTQVRHEFVRQFPPIQVWNKRQSVDEYLSDIVNGIRNTDITTGEIILLALTNQNPALERFSDMFDDSDLVSGTQYRTFVESLEKLLDDQPPISGLGKTLFASLREPIAASPNSLEGQLMFIREQWADFLPQGLIDKLSLAVDLLQEETRMRGFGPGQSVPMQFGTGTEYDESYPEPSRFSHDADWMSNVVLIAKTAYVWLDQLSRQYQRPIRYLNEIPDEELDRLARWGITGLWLIGLWERSTASQKIKQIMGNPEAVASAYSLYDYVIAADLGGEEAYRDLNHRARQRGIRLASDMVPNHVGIFSKWVIEHPDWFIQNHTPPYPAYQFTGVDLSEDERTVIQIEDGYWEHRDAAVVFKRIDKWTGDVRYIYHGNDGTSMPWNDTAQLNFMLPEVREAVIQTILHVARKFSIIRFDAAMTLAKRHFQRLWFPKPGDGGAVPSRAEHGMSKAEFDHVFPEEFWREVVERVASEVPDTLLLAEAFWLMEGYFVRTLGMHRVYNSAFMNMLKDEDNANYRQTIKNVLEFSPEILNRFVNFMSNPDEGTAIEQFGRDDKYYGVAVLMVTLPGLPMFGHGQIEGLREKYGMEYRRAYWEEDADSDMISRHEREIFPLMQRRHLFSGAENFVFYDFNSPEGWVDENVYAHSNRSGDERAVVLYNNAFNTTQGWIRRSTAINRGDAENKRLEQPTLAEGLNLDSSEGVIYSFRDHMSGLQYLRTGRQIAEEGLYVVLHAYQCQVFLDFRRLEDTDRSWHRLADQLNGAGVADIQETYREMQLESLLNPFRKLISASTEDVDKVSQQFFAAAVELANADCGFNVLVKRHQNLISKVDSTKGSASKLDTTEEIPTLVLRCWAIFMALSELGEDNAATVDRIEDWLLDRIMTRELVSSGINYDQASADSQLAKILLLHESLLTPVQSSSLTEAVENALDESRLSSYLIVNRYEENLYFNKERFERFVLALEVATVIRSSEDKSVSLTKSGIRSLASKLTKAAEVSGYQVAKFLDLLSD